MLRALFITTLVSFYFSAPLIAGEPELNVDHDQLKENMAKLDSQIQELNTSLEAETEKYRKEQFERTMQQNQRNLEHFMAAKKERERKRNRWNVFRFVLIIVTIIAAIVGRSAKKKAQRAQTELDSSEANNQSE